MPYTNTKFYVIVYSLFKTIPQKVCGKLVNDIRKKMKIKNLLMTFVSYTFDILPFNAKKDLSKIMGSKSVNFLVAGRRKYKFTLLKKSPDFAVKLILEPKDDYFYLESVGKLSKWEEEALNSWVIITENCETVIDIGAHFGVYSFVAAQQKNVKHVFSVEPNPFSRKRFAENFRVNLNTDKIIVLPFALGKIESTSNLIAPSGRLTSSGSQLESSPINFDVSNYAVVAAVRVVTLDSLVNTTKMYKIGAIKIDAEGNEHSILSGGTKTLEKYHPILMIEILNYSQFNKIKSFLKDFNYQTVVPLDGEVVSQQKNNALADLALARNYIFKPSV